MIQLRAKTKSLQYNNQYNKRPMAFPYLINGIVHAVQGQKADVYMTTRGAIQGCPLGMLAFCVSYMKSASWIKETMKAAGPGGERITHVHARAPHAHYGPVAGLASRAPHRATDAEHSQRRHKTLCRQRRIRGGSRVGARFAGVGSGVCGNQGPQIQTAMGGIQ